MVWELEGYDTEMREARCREYTTSQLVADAWEQIPRIQFTDSGHGIVFSSKQHSGKRRPTIRRMDHADRWMRRFRLGGDGLTAREWLVLVMFDSYGDMNEGKIHDLWPLVRSPRQVVNALVEKSIVDLGSWYDDAGYDLHLTELGKSTLDG